jgi:hypothetical protein
VSEGPRDADAVEQLQRGLLTMIGAARVVLDALEVVVADRSRLDELTARGRAVVAAVVGPLLGGSPGAQPSDPADDGATRSGG